MKTKYILQILSLLILVAGLTSCSKEEAPKEVQEYTISLDLKGEISISEEPLTRAFTTDDLIGVQVYEDNNPYAYGLFDDVSRIKIPLHSNHKYKFVATVVKDGKNKIRYNQYTNTYSTPFTYAPSRNPSQNNHQPKISTGFTHDDFFVMPHLASGRSELSDNTTSEYPSTDRFYGEIDNYTPTENGSVAIDLKRTAFGLKYEVSGITDGTVSVKIKNNSRTFFENTSITSDYQSEEEIFTFSDVYSAWLYADNYTESITVSASWLRGVGINQDLGSKTVQIKRNAMNIIRIKLGAVNYDGNIGIEVEEETDMDEETVTGTLE